MYKATQNISVSSQLSDSNLETVPGGVSNELGDGLRNHNHDDRYYTESEIDTQVAGLNARIDALDPEQGVGIFTDVAFSIPLSSWTEDSTSHVWRYTYINPVITARSGIDVLYDSSYRTAMSGDVDVVKNTGNIVFTTNRQPIGNLSGTVRVFDSVQGVLTTDKGGTGATTAQGARENLGIYANNIHMSSSDNTSIETAVNENSTDISNLADGLAILANGNTHAAVANGQAVFVRNHSALSDGLYWAKASIAANATLSTSNLTADESGGLNKLKGDVDALNSNFITETILNCNTYNREGVGRIVDSTLNRPFDYGVLKNLTYSLGNYGYRAQIAISVSNQRVVYRTSNDGGATWSGWKELAMTSDLSYGQYTFASQTAMDTGLTNLLTTVGARATTAIYLYPNFGDSIFGGVPGVATIVVGTNVKYGSALFHNYSGVFYGKCLNGTWTWKSLTA